MDRPKFVAEFTTNHIGNLNLLLRMVESAAWAGADFIKMQKKDVSSYYSKEKLELSYDSPYGKTYYDYRSIFEFGLDDFVRFDRACRENEIKWYSTIQDLPSLYFIMAFNPTILKIASSGCRDWKFLSRIHSAVPMDTTVVVSVAGSKIEDILKVVEIFDGRELIIQHCVAEYPCRVDHLRLGNIPKLIELFQDNTHVTVGYSGHEVGIIPSAHAIRLGAKMVERHFCESRHSFVHHIECSLEPAEFRMLTNDYKSYWNKELPDEAFAMDFGMSCIEEKFLVHQTYDNTFLMERSEWEK